MGCVIVHVKGQDDDEPLFLGKYPGTEFIITVENNDGDVIATSHYSVPDDE